MGAHARKAKLTPSQLHVVKELTKLAGAMSVSGSDHEWLRREREEAWADGDMDRIGLIDRARHGDKKALARLRRR